MAGTETRGVRSSSERALCGETVNRPSTQDPKPSGGLRSIKTVDVTVQTEHRNRRQGSGDK
jgi:hypothetical protein